MYLTSNILTSRSQFLPWQTCIFSAWADTLFLWKTPVLCLFPATPSYWIFQMALPLHCCSQRTLTPTGNTMPALTPILRGKYVRGVFRISQINRDRRGTTQQSVTGPSITLIPRPVDVTSLVFSTYGPLLFLPSSAGLARVLNVRSSGPNHCTSLPHL